MKQELNERLTKTGPGTPMGELFRRFWLPALLESEISEPDGEVVPLRLLGEDLVAFRDTEGRIGILDRHCSHRLASLEYARNEECGLRCIYHGRKFDVDGNCVDMPSEPLSNEKAKQRNKIKAYPTIVRGGAVWIYMGPAECQPPPPEFEWARFPENRRAVIKRYQPCNYAQALEGGIDSAHISFLHRNTPGLKTEGAKSGKITAKYASQCRHPEFSINETGYGLQIVAKRQIEGEPLIYYRVTQFMLPCFQMVPPILEVGVHKTNPTYGNVWVPIDDFQTWNWGFSSDVVPLSQSQLDFMGKSGLWGDLDDDFLPLQNVSNQYEFDRQYQRTGNFSGIKGVRNQDAAVVESMGPIVDRTKEHLGHSDTAIAMFRNQILRLADELENGKEPDAPHRPDIFNVRSVAVLVDVNEKLEDVLPELEAGEPLTAKSDAA